MNVEQIWWSQISPTPVVVKPLPNIRTRGQFFELEDGTLWTAIQCSDFNLLARYLRNEDIRPVLAQRQSCGFNLLRVWTLFDISGIGDLTQLHYDLIPAFTTLCASYGLYVEFTAYTGINDPLHWTHLCDAARVCQTKPILELVNELDQNSNEPDYFGRIFHLNNYSQPEGLISSHGSNGSEHTAVRPWWSYEEFHTNDASEWWRKSSHNAMELAAGAEGLIGSGVPILSNENTRYPDKASSLIYAYDAAEAAALLCAGSCYHSVRGKTSELWDGLEETCARRWALGARQVDLRYQKGSYRHPVELEGPNDLRVYQRVLPDRSAYTVHVRR